MYVCMYVCMYVLCAPRAWRSRVGRRQVGFDMYVCIYMYVYVCIRSIYIYIYIYIRLTCMHVCVMRTTRMEISSG